MSEMRPPEGDIDDYNRKLQAIRTDVEPVRKEKPKTEPLFFILGFLTPLALSWVTGVLVSLMPSFNILGAIAQAMLPGFFVGALVMLLVGRSNGNTRLASYGKGGVWAYAVALILALLAFGTCLISLGSWGR